MKNKKFIALILLVLTRTELSLGALFSAGNLLVSSENVLYEVTTSGNVIQSFSIPSPAGESARDIVMDSRGRVHIYNGTFDPYISTFTPSTESWTHTPITGWSTVNNGTYGGIAAFNDFVFLTDMTTYGNEADQAKGILRYNTESGDFTRFAEGIEPIDLTIGYDGLLYALYPGGSPEGRIVTVYNPMTLAFIKTTSLADIFGHTGHRAIAVDAQSDMYIADWDGELQVIDSSGVLKAGVNLIGDWIGRPITPNLYD